MGPGTLPWLKRMLVDGEIFAVTSKAIDVLRGTKDEPTSEPSPEVIDTRGVEVEPEVPKPPACSGHPAEPKGCA